MACRSLAHRREYHAVYMCTAPGLSPRVQNARLQWRFAAPGVEMPAIISPHIAVIGEVARASLARVTELCGAAF